MNEMAKDPDALYIIYLGLATATDLVGIKRPGPIVSCVSWEIEIYRAGGGNGLYHFTIVWQYGITMV